MKTCCECSNCRTKDGKVRCVVGLWVHSINGKHPRATEITKQEVHIVIKNGEKIGEMHFYNYMYMHKFTHRAESCACFTTGAVTSITQTPIVGINGDSGCSILKRGE